MAGSALPESATQGNLRFPTGATFQASHFQRPATATIAAITADDPMMTALTDGSRYDDNPASQQQCSVVDDTSNGYLRRQVEQRDL